MKREQDEEGRIYWRTRLQRVVAHIIVNEKPFDIPLESVGDNYFLDHLQHLYQDKYDHATYSAWLIDRPFLEDFEQFSYYGHSYMIKPLEYLHGANMDLFILSSMLLEY